MLGTSITISARSRAEYLPLTQHEGAFFVSYVCYISATIFHLEVFIMVRKLFATLLLVVLCVCAEGASAEVAGMLTLYDNDFPE